MKKYFVSVSALLLLAFGVLSTNVFGTGGDISIEPQSVNPKDGYRYSIKRAWEKGVLFVLSVSKEKKVDYYQELLDKRLSELYKISEGKEIAQIEKGTQRYFTTAGELSEFIINHRLTGKIDSTRELFEKHLVALESFEQNFNPSTSEWRFLEDDINYLKTYLSRLTR